jgi:hypothetical protein
MQKGRSGCAGVVEEHGIEPTPVDGKAVRDRDRLLHVGSPSHSGLGNPDAEGLDGRARYAQGVEQRPDAGAQRLPDVGPREQPLLHHGHLVARLRQGGSQAAPGGAAAENADVDLARHDTLK